MTLSSSHRWRRYAIFSLLLLVLLGVVWRLFQLGVMDRAFLQTQSNNRSVRVVSLPAHRGMISDRRGVPLAVSTPMNAVWVNPKKFVASDEQLVALSTLLNMQPEAVTKLMGGHKSRSFLYLSRNVPPAVVAEIQEMDLPGLFFEQQYHRYYPQGEVMAHILGRTNIDDKGLDGLELQYNGWLQGQPGKQWVVRDRLGHVVDILKTVQAPKQGQALTLSVDSRIQYMAYHFLNEAVQKQEAKSGSVVVLDVKTGEVLAMANEPTYNPNQKAHLAHDGRYRNRAITDVFEPGSTMKAFSIANALQSGKYTPDTVVDTNPGYLRVEGNLITDEHINHGVLSVTQVLQKSSNIGATKMTLSLPPASLWHSLHRFGFGVRPGTGFPGEAGGQLAAHQRWHPFELATLSFGYGVSASPLQLAMAYAVLAADGQRLPVTFIKRAKPPSAEQIVSPAIAHEMRTMLEAVVAPGGTGRLARVPGYRVAGKTSTAYLAGKHGYDKRRYLSSFVGLAPVSDPKLVVAVVIREPGAGRHYGGLVAAPVFAKIMGGALRMMAVMPDGLSH